MKTSSYADKVINLNCQAIRFAWPWLNSKCWKFNQFSQWITDGLKNLQIYWFSFQCHWTSASDCHSHPNRRWHSLWRWKVLKKSSRLIFITSRTNSSFRKKIIFPLSIASVNFLKKLQILFNRNLFETRN